MKSDLNSEKLENIENFLFKNKHKDASAAQDMADILGVYINIKPSALIGFSEYEMSKADLFELKDLLSEIGIKTVFKYKQIMSGQELEWDEHIFVSKDYNKAVKLHDSFFDMWEAMDDAGQIINKKVWTKSTRKMGKSLGYPKTAVKCFIKSVLEDRDDRNSLTTCNGCRYFAHSKKHIKKEIKVYDDPVDRAVKKYAPKTQALFDRDFK